MPRRGRKKIRSNLQQREYPCTRISEDDVNLIAQSITVPAMEDGPLFKTMFPKWPVANLTQRFRVLQWYAALLKDEIDTGGEHKLIQVSDLENYPLGFCGWTLNWRVPLNQDRRDERQKAFPGLLDPAAWLSLMEKLKVERDIVLEGVGPVYRLTCTFVHPMYQRRGVGKRLLKWACKHIDDVEMPVFLVAPPNAVDFYAKFGFEVLSVLETEHGAMSTMFRKARLKADMPEVAEEVTITYSEVESEHEDEYGGEGSKDAGHDGGKIPGQLYIESDDSCDEHWL